MTTIPTIIKHLFNEENQLTQWPSKKQKKKQQAAIEYFAQLFDASKQYSEKEVSDLLNLHHTFGDAALLRRELVGYGLLDRTKDCRAYWLVDGAELREG